MTENNFKEKRPLKITIGLLEEEKINSLLDFKEYLDKIGILNTQIRKDYIEKYAKLIQQLKDFERF